MKMSFVAAMSVVVALVCSLEARAAQGRPLNIVHIVADDLGYDDVGCFGSTDIKTPHIDRLAAQGMRFTSFYAPHAICTPSRAAMMTGCYAPRVGLTRVLFPDSDTGLNADEITIAELLKGKGYATACIGKWHLGYQREFLPTRHGFDVFLGIPYPNDHGPERLGKDGKSRGFPGIPLIRGEEIIEQPAQLASLPERFAEASVKFIAQHKDRPFYLHLSNIETHTPWLVTRPFQNKSDAGVYGDAVHCFDWLVGRVMNALTEQKIENDTLIVVTSDNGPLVGDFPELEGIYGHAATVDTSRKHVLRGGKYQSRYEGGTRVTCVMRWPGKIKEGTSSDAVIAGFDLYTTFAKLGGADVPTDRIVDGKDLSPLMLGEAGAKSPHEAFYYWQGYQLVGVRAGKWKLVLGDRELYDLDADRGETTNVAAANADVVKQLLALAEKARSDLGDGPKNTGKNRRPPGQVKGKSEPQMNTDKHG